MSAAIIISFTSLFPKAVGMSDTLYSSFVGAGVDSSDLGVVEELPLSGAVHGG